MTVDELKKIILEQGVEHQLPDPCITRAMEEQLAEFQKNKEIIVLMGIRRSGKSVLLQKLRANSKEKDYYFNFEDDRLIHFSLEDFQLLYESFQELFGLQKTFYLDEIQNIPGWETFVRRLYNSGNKIYITGSNATLFSEELGTRLTGRYFAIQVYPLSFYEFAQYQKSPSLTTKNWSTQDVVKFRKLFSVYCDLGGFPEYVQIQQKEYLHSLYESILYRDIIVRYKLTTDRVIKELVFYLASHVSCEMTYRSLQKLLGVGNSSTISDYCSYLENSYLCFFMNRYSESLKAQMQSPKKVFFIDSALAQTVGFRFSENKGRVLENVVYLFLKQQKYDLYYYREKKECDFVLKQATQISGVIQVCQTLKNLDTRQREIDGLVEAMQRFSLTRGTILTEHEEGNETITIKDQSYQIIILPVWKYLLSPVSSVDRASAS